MPCPRRASRSRVAIMIPHGFAAQPIPSTTTLTSAELTGGLGAPSGEPTEPASRSGASPILWDRVCPLERRQDMTRAGRPIRLLVLTAPVGEGHLAAARVLAEDLVRRNPSAEVTVRDVLAEFPGPLRWFLNDAYRWQLTAAPWLFGLLFGSLR